MILMIDNYDSFTYNVAQYLAELGHPSHVVRNDKISLAEINERDIKALIVSPGPGSPDEAGISLDAIRYCAEKRIPVLGICLGHQCVGVAFGGRIAHAPKLMHGKVSPISHNASSVFKNIPNGFLATRYHSLVIAPESMPRELNVTATADDGAVMGVAHKSLPIHGVQFHPESIITEHGHKLLANFLELAELVPANRKSR